MATNHEAGGSNPSECKASAGPAVLAFRPLGPPLRWFTPLRLALLLTALDLAWAAQALSAVPRHQGSIVAMLSLTLWVTLHLPSAVLASLLMKLAGALEQGPEGLPLWTFWMMAAFGLAQTFALSYAAAAWLRKRRKP